MEKDAYTLKERRDTNELHLFKGSFKENGCTSPSNSICNGMKKSESSRNIFTCKDENEARLACAKEGRAVCGTCVSHLYSTY